MAPIQTGAGDPTYASGDTPTGAIPKTSRPERSHAHPPFHALASSSTSGVSSEANAGLAEHSLERAVPPPPPQNLFLERLREQQDKLKTLRAQHFHMLQCQDGLQRVSDLTQPNPIMFDPGHGGPNRSGSHDPMLQPNHQTVYNALAQLEQRISMMSNVPHELTDERSSLLPQLESEYLDRLNLMNNDRRENSRVHENATKTVDKSGPNGEDLHELKDRLKSLQDMVNSLEQQRPPAQVHSREPPPGRCPWEASGGSNPHHSRPSHDQMMVEMREQLRLQKELHLRRKELEDLMKKDIVESMQKNSDTLRNFSDSKSDISFRSWFHDDRSLRHLDANPPDSSSARSRRFSLSSFPSNVPGGHALEEGTAKTFAHLQAQIDSLQSEIQRLGGGANRPVPPMTSSTSTGGAPASLDPGVLEAIFQQQSQIQQLTSSLNQCFQGMMLVQRDVNGLQKVMDKLKASKVLEAATNGDRGAREFDPWTCHLPDIDFRPIAGNPRGAIPPSTTSNGMGATLEASHASWPNSASFGPPPDHPWNLNAPLVGHLSEHESNAALNNQVAPGMRANNYWDNFRSFSRQNRLSNSSPSGIAHPMNIPPHGPNSVVGSAIGHPHLPPASVGGAPNVAQVTPRQLQPTPTVPTPAAPGGDASAPRGSTQPRQAYVEPHYLHHNSPPRPRRKQKINREQNRESTGEARSAAMVLPSCTNASGGGRGNEPNAAAASSGGAAAAVMVYPMPQNHDRNINRADLPASSSTSGEAAGAAAQVTSSTNSHMVVNSLTRSIYQQIGSLINEHETRPDNLVRILQDIQVLGRSFPASAGRPQSEIEAPFGGWPSNAGPVYPDHLHDNRDNRHSMATSSPKVPIDKRFSFSRSETSSERSSAAPFNAINTLAGASGGQSGARPVENSLFHPFSLPQDEGSEPAEDSGDPGRHGSEQSRRLQASSENAVPKNVQRNQISRERDTRKFRREKPRNMQQAAIVLASHSSSSEAIEDKDATSPTGPNRHHPLPDDGNGFINVNFRLPMASVAASNVERSHNGAGSSSSAGLNEMAEADQDQSPDSSVQAMPKASNVDGAKGYSGDSSEEEDNTQEEVLPNGEAIGVVRPSDDQLGAMGGGPSLERLPTRLKPRDLEHQRQREEASMQSLVDEVLNTSSDSELVEDGLVVVNSPRPPSQLERHDEDEHP